MRLQSVGLAALITLAAPSATRAQLPPLSDTFSSILQTFQFGGCGVPGSPSDLGFPCASGTASYGVLRSGAYGFRFDLLADFGALPPRYSDISTVSLGPLSSFDVSFTSSPVGCYGRYADGRCFAFSSNGLGTGSLGDPRNGPLMRVSSYVNDLFTLAAGEDPRSLRLERLSLVYDYFSPNGFGSFEVQPAITTISTIPEPSALALTAAGLAAAGVARRRRA